MLSLLKLDNGNPCNDMSLMRAVLFLLTIKKESGLQKLFYTHPPIAERVARLEKCKIHRVGLRVWKTVFFINLINSIQIKIYSLNY